MRSLAPQFPRPPLSLKKWVTKGTVDRIKFNMSARIRPNSLQEFNLYYDSSSFRYRVLTYTRLEILTKSE